MKRFAAITYVILMIALVFVSCGGSDELISKSWREPGLHESPPESPVYISAEIPTTNKIAADTEFTVTVGIGQGTIYSEAVFRIKADGFEITDPTGNTVNGEYEFVYSDFDDEKYNVKDVDGKRSCGYFEAFTFKYVGGGDGEGVITFSIEAADDVDSSTSGGSVGIYYAVRGGKIKLATKQPKQKTDNGKILTEAAS